MKIFNSLISRIALAICLLVIFPFRSFGEELFGPFEIEDQFPLSRYHLSPVGMTPQVNEPGEISARTSFIWANTATRRTGAYKVDAETRTFAIDGAYGVTKKTTFGVKVPVIWQGGGVLDHPIYEWHETLGLPQGERDEPGFNNDEFSIDGRNNDGSRFNIKDKGYTMGNVVLYSKYDVSSDAELSQPVVLTTRLRLPTASDYYTQDGLDYGADLSTVFSLQRFNIYLGAGGILISDEEEQNVHFNHTQEYFYSSGEYRLTESWSAIVGATAATSAVREVEKFPDYSVYLDFGVKGRLSDTMTLELACRENPFPSKGTSDVGFLMALSSSF